MVLVRVIRGQSYFRLSGVFMRTPEVHGLQLSRTPKVGLGITSGGQRSLSIEAIASTDIL